MRPTDEPICLYIVFSDHFIREAGSGKFSLIGIFHQLIFNSFPATAPNFCITAALNNFEGDLENVKVTMRLEERGSGHVACSVSSTVNSKVKFTREMLVEIPVRMPRFSISGPGEYELVVLVDNEKVGVRTLKILSTTGGPTSEIKGE